MEYTYFFSFTGQKKAERRVAFSWRRSGGAAEFLCGIEPLGHTSRVSIASHLRSSTESIFSIRIAHGISCFAPRRPRPRRLRAQPHRSPFAPSPYLVGFLLPPLTSASGNLLSTNRYHNDVLSGSAILWNRLCEKQYASYSSRSTDHPQ